MRIQNKAFLLSLFDLTENVLTLMIFEGNGIEQKSESNPTKIYDEILFLRARRANTKKKKYWLPAWCVCACVRACRAISEFTMEQNNHKGNQPFGWACVFVFASVNVWRVQFEKKISLSNVISLFAHNLKYCQKVDTLWYWIEPDQQSQTSDKSCAPPPYLLY